MKHVVMGTAGHIDHGKTALVKRLTGIDTDRLEEEKRRGMTIELGFAPLTLPSGNVVSIIDVPGHEKFVKTMVAGSTGIDFVMLVIAADEGVMPQTIEHLEILSILGIDTGVVALTKSELVDAEWLDTVRTDIAKTLKGTSLAGIEIIPVSAFTGSGIDRLTESLERLTREAAGRTPQDLFRLPADRVFTMTGYGTVVTGTVRGGAIHRGDLVEALPQGIQGKIRGIQVHSREVDTAEAGDRCALNISGIEKSELSRGNVIALPGTLRPVSLIDAVIVTVRDRGGILHNQRVHFHTGTQEVLARIRVLEQDKIGENSRGYVQIRFESPVLIVRGDKFILRSYSPVATLGGGKVLFHDTFNRKRFAPETGEALRTGENGTIREIILHILRKAGAPLSEDQLWLELYEDRGLIGEALAKSVSSGEAVFFPETGKYADSYTMKVYTEKIRSEFAALQDKYPFRYQLDREQIKSRVLPDLDAKDHSAILAWMTSHDILSVKGSQVAESSGGIVEKILAGRDVQKVEQQIIRDGFALKNPEILAEELKMDLHRLSEIERFLMAAGRVTDLGSGWVVHNDNLSEAMRLLRGLIDTKGSITAAEARDHLGIGRKAAIALLEHLDTLGVTKRDGNDRRPGIHYMDLYI